MAGNLVTTLDNHLPIRRVLCSVSDKRGLETLIPGLLAINPNTVIYSTGGTYAKLNDLLGDKAATNLIQVSDYTGQPETQGGLVKTLDFKIYLGLLTETYNESHQNDLKRTEAVALDMVVVNLYPFRETVAKPDCTVEMARANIDIGGPCMVRASAKNYLRVASVTDPSDYESLLETMKKQDGKLALADRFRLAQKAFAHTASYDTAIAEFLAKQNPESVPQAYDDVR